MNVIDVFKDIPENERSKIVTEALIKVENGKYRFEKPMSFTAGDIAQKSPQTFL